MEDQEEPFAHVLPQGSMVRNLRWLATSIETLLASAAALQSAEALEYVAIIECTRYDIYWRSPEVAAFMEWVARHPPLRSLSVDAPLRDPEEYDWPDFVICLLKLLRHRPGLSVRCPGFGDDEGPTLDELFFSEASSLP